MSPGKDLIWSRRTDGDVQYCPRLTATSRNPCSFIDDVDGTPYFFSAGLIS